MIIGKFLKQHKFLYDTELKQFEIISNQMGIDSNTLTRVEMFSLMRFIVRVAQKGNKK